MKYYSICCLLFSLLSCDRLLESKADYRLSYVNKSTEKVVFITSMDYVHSSNYSYTSGCPGQDDDRLSPNEEKISIIYSRWEDKILQTPMGKIIFFVYNSDTAIKYSNILIGSCDTLKKRQDLILKRFEVDLDYLNANNWKLIYP